MQLGIVPYRSHGKRSLSVGQGCESTYVIHVKMPLPDLQRPLDAEYSLH